MKKKILIKLKVDKLKKIIVLYNSVSVYLKFQLEINF